MRGHFQLTEPGQLVERVKRFLAHEDRRRAQTAAHLELVRRIGGFIAIAVVASARAHNINDPIWPWIKPAYSVLTHVCSGIYVFMHTHEMNIHPQAPTFHLPLALRVLASSVVNKWNANELLGNRFCDVTLVTHGDIWPGKPYP